VVGTFGTHEVGEKCLQGLVGRPEEKISLRKPSRRWEDNIKMDLRKIGIDEANWIRLAQDVAQLRVFVNMVVNLRIS
jgi:hypothetical protein